MLPLSQLAGWLYVFDFRPRKRREITLREETMKNQPCSPRMFVAFIKMVFALELGQTGIRLRRKGDLISTGL